MAQRDGFWKLDHLSDTRLLESLSSVLRTQHRTLAALVAHLAEVEERRLHLEAAFSSMFAYCVGRLGMSEDEACRRIDLARLARTFPALFAELESGQITLSVALLLKPALTPDNHRELLCALRGKPSQQARELLAARFPKDDVPSSIRKLPERRRVGASEVAQTNRLATLSPAPLPATPLPTAYPSLQMPEPLPTRSFMPSGASKLSPATEDPQPSRAPRAASAAADRGLIEPLSAQRYRIQFTAHADLKRKLELARDLLRHAHPSGDFAPIVARALNLLLDDLQRRRFGAGTRRKSAPTAEGSPPAAESNPSSHPGSSSPTTAAPPPAPGSGASAASAAPNAAPPHTASATPAHAHTSRSPIPAAKPRRSHIPRAARRVVLERDGLGCSWIGAHGVRCGSRAWLELDHRQPSGKGGSSQPNNVRLLCRAHNQLAAEHAYGRAHIERASGRARGPSAGAQSCNPRSEGRSILTVEIHNHGGRAYATRP